jgi:hypothetical protein
LLKASARGSTLKRFWVLAATSLVAVVALAARDANPGAHTHGVHSLGNFVLALVIFAGVVYWIATVAELLRLGPRSHLAWWAACLVVVVVLGPLGALASHLATPAFVDDSDRSLRH